MPAPLCPRLFRAECWIGLIDLMGVHGVIVVDGGTRDALGKSSVLHYLNSISKCLCQLAEAADGDDMRR